MGRRLSTNFAQVGCAAFGFGAAETRVRGKSRAESVKHRSHLVADVGEVTSPGEPSVSKQ